MKKSLTAVAALSVLGLVPAVSSASATTPVSLTGLTAKQILNISLKAAVAKKSATTVGTTSVLGISVREVTTSGPRSGYGNESINGHKGSIIYTGGVVYTKFDAFLIKFNYGVTDTAVDNKWISVTKASKFYRSLAQGITYPSVLQQLTPAGTLSALAPTTINGVSAIGIVGKVSATFGLPKGTQTRYVSATAPSPPLTHEVRASERGVSVDIVITPKNWGVAVSVSPPKVFTPVAKTKL